MTAAWDFRGPGVPIRIPDTGAPTVTIPFEAGFAVGAAGNWTFILRRDKGSSPATSLLTPTITTDSVANTVDLAFTQATIQALIGTGSPNWNGYWHVYNSSAAQKMIGGSFTIDRTGSASGSSTTPTVLLSGDSVATVETVISAPANLFVPYSRVASHPEGRALVARTDGTNGVDVGYPTPKGPKLVVIGTSIERGTGGDADLIGTFTDGRPSNADWALHACANSELVYWRQAGSGGDTLGGIGVLLADAAIGATTLDIGFSYPDYADDAAWSTATLTADGLKLRGPHLPYRTQTVFFDYGFSDSASTGAAVEACYVNTAPATITGGVRCTLLAATTKAHSAGDIVRWGMIGRFEYDVTRLAPDIVGIGGAANDLDDGDDEQLTATEIAEGQQILCEMTHEADAVPVVTTICARPTLQDETDAANVAIRANAELYGHRCADFFRVTVDPASGDMLADISYDTVHPNQQGAELLAAEFLTAVGTTELRGPAFRATSFDGYTANMVPNGTFSAGTSGSGGTLTPVGWEVQEFFSSNILNTVVVPRLTDPVKGNLLRVTSTAGKGTHGAKATIPIAASGNSAGFVAGNRVFLRAFVRLSGFKSDGYAKANIRLICTGNSGAASIGLIWDWGRDFDGGYITSAAVDISTAVGTLSSLSLQVYIAGPPLAGADVGYGVLEVGDVTIGNLTRGGL